MPAPKAHEAADSNIFRAIHRRRFNSGAPCHIQVNAGYLRARRGRLDQPLDQPACPRGPGPAFARRRGVKLLYFQSSAMSRDVARTHQHKNRTIFNALAGAALANFSAAPLQ
jgi:hypothetical protein